MHGGSDLSAREIAGMLNQQAAALAPVLLPNGRTVGPYFCVGSVEGEPGDSLKLHLKGAKVGKWSDFSRADSERGGTGDMLDLVQLVHGMPDKAAAIQWAKRHLGIDGRLSEREYGKLRDRAAQARAKAERACAGEIERKRLGAEGLWIHAGHLHLAPPAMGYFKGRGIDFTAIGRVPRALRFRADVGIEWCDAGTGEVRKGQLPAVLSAMIGGDGRHLATHATFLDRAADGTWRNLKELNPKNGRTRSAKRIFGPYKGAHIPLNKGASRASLKDVPAGTPIEVSEGIEDGLSVAMAFPGLRVVAAATLGNIGALELPAQAGALTLIGQHDAAGSAAESSLEKQILAQQQRARADGSGRTVAIRWPEAGFKDFNDQLRGIRAQVAAGGSTDGDPRA